MTKEIVVAAYDRDLSWMDKFNHDVKKTIYRKGKKSDNENEIFIEPNRGRDVHTFFNHIYINYDNLSDYTFFVQDNPFDHWEGVIDVVNGDMDNLDEFVSLKIGGYYGFHYNTAGNAWNMWDSQHFGGGKIIACFGNGMPQDHNSNINVDDTWDILFDMNHPPIYEFIPGGHFGLTKEHAKIRSKNFYKSVCDLLLNDEYAPWSIERLECYIFEPRLKSKI